MRDEQVSIALHTPRGGIGQTVRYRASRHGLRLRQESVAMLALDMLRRWLNGGGRAVKRPAGGGGNYRVTVMALSRRRHGFAAAVRTPGVKGVSPPRPAFADLHHSP